MRVLCGMFSSELWRFIPGPGTFSCSRITTHSVLRHTQTCTVTQTARRDTRSAPVRKRKSTEQRGQSGAIPRRGPCSPPSAPPPPRWALARGRWPVPARPATLLPAYFSYPVCPPSRCLSQALTARATARGATGHRHTAHLPKSSDRRGWGCRCCVCARPTAFANYDC